MNLFDLSAKITLDSKGYEQGIDKAKDKTSKLKDSIGKGLATAGKVGLKALTVAGAGITALVTASTKSYADYEQLVGGVDTLFKNSSDKVQEYASNAYKTAGMSANDYMETVTSFSASLLQSLGGDTERASEYANQAITDMSDNANKMGSDIETLKTAYAGFAKGQFMLLDNLKLGYGGTKEEMARLLEDAEKLSGKEFDISSYADITEAIHIIQTEMGITGTTVLEASTTIEGSLNSVKSAWQNLMTGMADSDADLSGLMGKLVESTGTLLTNLLPVVNQALLGVSSLIEQVFPVIMAQIPAFITEFLPTIANSAVNIIQSLVQGLSDNAMLIGTETASLIAMLITKVVELLPTILQAGIQIVIGLAEGLAEALPDLVAQIPILIDGLITAIVPLLPTILQAGIDIVLQLAQGLVEAMPDIVSQIPILISAMMNAIVPMYPQLIDAAIQIVAQLALGLISALPDLVDQVPTLIDGFISAFTGYKDNFFSSGEETLNTVWEGMKETWKKISTWFTDKWNSLFGKKATVSFGTEGGDTDGSHAGGLSYVPYDGYTARLHKGERILTAKENKGFGAGTTIIQNIYAEKQTASDLEQSAMYQARKVALLGV